MKDLATDIIRQRVLIEGFYDKVIDNEMIKDYLKKIVEELGFRVEGEPMVADVEDREPYTLFVSLAQFGAAIYIWTERGFASILLHSSGEFDQDKAVKITKKFFKFIEMEVEAF